MSIKNRKVLIVEDNELNMKLFNDLLITIDCEVIQCLDPLAALNLIQVNMPNLILMDIQLPKISGLDIIKWVKEDSSLSHIPIIAITAFALQEDKDKILALGCEGYMSKPISMQPFLDKVNEYLV
ncbi:MAG: response regulator [Alphaproteobacteria bacterium]|jgi:two-component system cell cycle response regulator DivK|tara:strand:- start:18285 stop:18659 length:375 start_codon:yes stop_codon:yes gene_type:complete